MSEPNYPALDLTHQDRLLCIRESEVEILKENIVNLNSEVQVLREYVIQLVHNMNLQRNDTWGENSDEMAGRNAKPRTRTMRQVSVELCTNSSFEKVGS